MMDGFSWAAAWRSSRRRWPSPPWVRSCSLSTGAGSRRRCHGSPPLRGRRAGCPARFSDLGRRTQPPPPQGLRGPGRVGLEPGNSGPPSTDGRRRIRADSPRRGLGTLGADPGAHSTAGRASGGLHRGVRESLPQRRPYLARQAGVCRARSVRRRLPDRARRRPRCPLHRDRGEEWSPGRMGLRNVPTSSRRSGLGRLTMQAWATP